jgi:hypothetical protein
MLMSASPIEEAGWDPRLLEFVVKLASQLADYAGLTCQRRDENPVARSVRVGG